MHVPARPRPLQPHAGPRPGPAPAPATRWPSPPRPTSARTSSETGFAAFPTGLSLARPDRGGPRPVPGAGRPRGHGALRAVRAPDARRRGRTGPGRGPRPAGRTLEARPAAPRRDRVRRPGGGRGRRHPVGRPERRHPAPAGHGPPGRRDAGASLRASTASTSARSAACTATSTSTWPRPACSRPRSPSIAVAHQVQNATIEPGAEGEALPEWVEELPPDRPVVYVSLGTVFNARARSTCSPPCSRGCAASR